MEGGREKVLSSTTPHRREQNEMYNKVSDLSIHYINHGKLWAFR